MAAVVEAAVVREEEVLPETAVAPEVPEPGEVRTGVMVGVQGATVEVTREAAGAKAEEPMVELEVTAAPAVLTLMMTEIPLIPD